MLPAIPQRIKFFIQVLFIYLCLLFFLRLGFFAYFLPGDLTWNGSQIIDVLHAFYLGLKFDLRLILALQLPLFLLSFVPFIELTKGKWGEEWWAWCLAICTLIIFVLYLIDFGTYAYIQVRLNSTLLKFLKNPAISIGMAWESYPILRWGVVTLGLFLLVRKLSLVLIQRLRRSMETATVATHRWQQYKMWQKVAVGFLIFLLWGIGIYGKISFYPLRWSEAYFGPNHFVSQLGLNPILYLLETMQFRQQDYDVQKVKTYYPLVAQYLGVEHPNSEQLNFDRSVEGSTFQVPAAAPGATHAPNIVVIIMESMAAYKTGAYGNKLDPTPYFDQLAKESLHFRRFYVPSQATARSIFGVVTGIPDVASVKTSSRNPFIVGQHSLINAFTQHQKYYFLGGSANWGNIRGIFTHNVPGVHIMEEGDYSSPRVDVWGISDYHLFEEAHRKFQDVEQKGQGPFLAIIQTAGFHRPYTIPVGQGNFQATSFAGKEQLLGQYGFISGEEYNSLRFQDYALGHFFELAKKSPYYQNTLFVIFGDHGLPVGESIHVPPGEKFHWLENFHVPMIMHAPALISPSENQQFISELDIFPTLAGIFKHKARNRSLGRNFFAPNLDRENSEVFTYTWYAHPAEFGLLNKDFYYKGNSEGQGGLFSYKDPQNFANDVQKQHPQAFEHMQAVARGLYYTSQYLLYHNQHQHQPQK